MNNNSKNVTAFDDEVCIKKNHRMLLMVATAIVLFYLLIPFVLSIFLKETTSFFLLFAWVYVIFLFLMTWGIGVWHYFYMKKYHLILERNVKQTN
ncbi:hypothetical protein [Gracilibacillus kekensis]|uniref:DUF485 domain-containing protein n=1 Tax=Gracilibacillus kekensis TaxID=1027249 RepID=A0A1M7Q7D2_9BACI|nr:hypothetical protein [Gracilibacillus kekensis]SHN26352.1 hypothetical protein SAMN05216179_2847 [Gracilibacillus kekensis]